MNDDEHIEEFWKEYFDLNELDQKRKLEELNILEMPFGKEKIKVITISLFRSYIEDIVDFMKKKH